MKHVITMALLLVLCVGVVWAQEPAEMEEFVSADEMLELSYPAGWSIRELEDFAGVEIVNDETIFEKIDGNDPLEEGDVRLGVVVLPEDFVLGVMQLSLEVELAELTESYAAFVEANNSLVTPGEPDSVILDEDREAGYIPFTGEKAEGAYLVLNHVPGFLTLVTLYSYPGELTEEVNELVLAVAASIHYGDAETPVSEAGGWSAEADFGSFSFTLTDAGISDATFNFQSFRCGAGSQSGSIQVTYSVPVPLKDGEFTLTLDMTPPPMPGQMPGATPRQTLTVQGTLSEDGQSAEGTWRAVSGSSSCGSGSWATNP